MATLKLAAQANWTERTKEEKGALLFSDIRPPRFRSRRLSVYLPSLPAAVFSPVAVQKNDFAPLYLPPLTPDNSISSISNNLSQFFQPVLASSL